MSVLTKSIRKCVKVCKSMNICGMADAHSFAQFATVSYGLLVSEKGSISEVFYEWQQEHRIELL